MINSFTVKKGIGNRYLKTQITWEHFAKKYYGYIKVK